MLDVTFLDLSKPCGQNEGSSIYVAIFANSLSKKNFF